MSADPKETIRTLPATPWGYLPPRMRVLYITTSRRTGSWLAEAFASDSACAVNLDEAVGAADGIAQLRDQIYDAVLVSHEPGQLDALELAEGLRAGGGEEPLVVLGQASEQEMAAISYEAGADAYVCVNTATTRMLLWIVARATERHNLIRENRKYVQADRHRLQQEQREAQMLLAEQRGLIRDVGIAFDGQPDIEPMPVDHQPAESSLPEPLKQHYAQLLRAHVIMGSGNLSAEMAALAELLADGGVSAPQVMQLHVEVLEELVRGLGSRSARHVMARADLLVLETLLHLTERYRQCGTASSAGRGRSSPAGF